jgi:hypothetical protein
VNLFKEHPQHREKALSVLTDHGRCLIQRLEFPDDFPPGKYWLEVRTPFADFGRVKPMKRELNVKGKQVKKK